MLASLLCAFLAAAPGARPVTFRELVDIAVRNDPEAAVARAERAGAGAALDLARWTRWSPRITATGAFGLVPGAEGDVTSSPDTARDLDDLGPFWRSRLDVSLPLLTFGRLSHAHRAAEAAVLSRDARMRARAGAMADLAARAYFGHLLAAQNLSLLREVRDHLDQHLAGIEKDEDADTMDLYRVRAYGFQIERLEAEAERGLAEAAVGLRILAGADVKPAADRLEALADDDASPEIDIDAAVDAQPEMREAALGAEAKALLARSEGNGLPVVTLEGRFDYGRAPGRTVQDNPFVYDAFNVRTAGAALAFRWDLNFKQTAARSARARAEAEIARARSAALRVKLRLDLDRLRARLDEARRMHDTSRRALGTTASWLRLAEENHGLGTADTSDVVDAYVAYLEARSSHFRAVHDLNVALVGWYAALGRGLPEEAR